MTNGQEKDNAVTEVAITGGYAGDGDRLWKNELLGPASSQCDLPVLPQKRHGHVTFTTSDKTKSLITCGGYGEGGKRSCLVLNTQTKEWKTMSDLLQDRIFSSVVSMPDAVVILGGVKDQETSSEYLLSGSDEWKAGPDLKGKGAYGSCAVTISKTSLLLIGGWNDRNQVRELDTYRPV